MSTSQGSEAITIGSNEVVIRIGLGPEPYVVVFRPNGSSEANGENQVVSVTKNNITQLEVPFGCSKIASDGAIFTVTDNASQGGKSGDK
jgi:hypothetical protein